MLQPFKYITVIMKEKTNDGMELDTADHQGISPRISLKDDLRYHPITLNDDGYGVPINADNKNTHASIGVLMESFNKTFAQHKVLIHGIVPMKAKGAVKAGMSVYWDPDAEGGELSKEEGIGPYVGKAMTSGNQDGDMIDVLIG